MLSILLIVVLASAMPIATVDTLSHHNMPEELDSISTRITTSAVGLDQRSICEVDPDSTTLTNCPPVHSVLRAALALFCLFTFLVLLHIWQAAKYNKIHAVFGTYLVDDTDSGAKTHYILLEEPDST